MRNRQQGLEIIAFSDIQQQLNGQGFARFRGADLKHPVSLSGDRRKLMASFEDLPPDPYCAQDNRLRQYGQAVLLPWCGVLQMLPPSVDSDGRKYAPYFQGTYNLEHRGEERKFPPLPSRVKNNRFLRELIWLDFSVVPWPARAFRRPVIVGVHLITYVARPGFPAVATPDVLHRDGEPFTFIHIIERRNVTGGVNLVVPAIFANRRPDEVPPSVRLAEVILEDELDTLIVDDTRVAHHVSPMHVMPGFERGWRSVVLVDFSLLVPEQYVVP